MENQGFNQSKGDNKVDKTGKTIKDYEDKQKEINEGFELLGVDTNHRLEHIGVDYKKFNLLRYDGIVFRTSNSTSDTYK